MAPAASAAILTTWQPQLKKELLSLTISNPCFGSISYWLSLGHMPVSESVTLTDLSGLSHTAQSWSGGRDQPRRGRVGVERGREVLPQGNIRRKTDAGPANPTVTLQGHQLMGQPSLLLPVYHSVIPFLSFSELPHYSASLNTPSSFPSYLSSCLSAFFSHLTPPAFPGRLLLAKVGEHLNF